MLNNVLHPEGKVIWKKEIIPPNMPAKDEVFIPLENNGKCREKRYLQKIVKEVKKPILVSSILSDKNIGFSTYIDENKTRSLSGYEGILELEI